MVRGAGEGRGRQVSKAQKKKKLSLNIEYLKFLATSQDEQANAGAIRGPSGHRQGPMARCE